jgi:predicted acylesterase/phospholipase RssA/CRP-like cAMP-binding protein
MDNDVIHLLKVHEYFQNLDEETLREIVGAAQVSHHDAGAVVHQPQDPLTSICFVLRGRLKAVRVDSRGDEHFFRMMERGEQYGMMLGALGTSVPVRIFALEPTTILTLDYERSMELTLKHDDMRRHWLRTYARGLSRHFFEAGGDRATNLLAILHESPATRGLAHELVRRLCGLGEEVGVLSDTDTWRSVPGVKFRSLSDGDRTLDVTEIRQQIVEWHQAKRVVIDIPAAWDWTSRLLEIADRALVFVRPGEIDSALRRLRELDVQERGWGDKTSIVWLLDEGGNTAPAGPQLRGLVGRDFKISNSEAKSPWGKALSNGMERLLHYLRGIRVGVALGGGAARGMSHLGVLKALEENGIVIDAIAGTSAGAMTGIVYSAGWDCDYSAGQFAGDLKLPWIFRRLPSGDYWYLLYKYRRGQFDPMLRKYLHDWKLEQLPLPCQSVTVDLVSGESVVRQQGDAVHAILESINLPGLSLPICRNGQALIDGGLVNNVPANVLVSQGCNFVIAVSVTAKIEHQFGKNKPDTPTPSMKAPSTLRTLMRSFVVQNYNLNDIGVRSADVVIAPDVTGFDLTEFMRAKDLAAIGERAALGQVPRIKQLLSRLDPALFRFDS